MPREGGFIGEKEDAPKAKENEEKAKVEDPLPIEIKASTKLIELKPERKVKVSGKFGGRQTKKIV